MNYPATELRDIKMNFYFINPDPEHQGILLSKIIGWNIAEIFGCLFQSIDNIMPCLLIATLNIFSFLLRYFFINPMFKFDYKSTYYPIESLKL